MSQSIQLPVTQVGLEQSIAAAMKRVGNSTQINLGTSSKQINALSQPLGRITGQADEFSKSMAAANARVLAFGASAGIIAGVSAAMVGLVTSTIKVEKSLVEINSVLNKSSAELDKFGQDIFNVAKNTGKSFDEVANGALELARQGLDAEDTLIRLNDALILSRLSGLDAAQSVEGLTAAFNSFKSSGITTAEILNKVVAVSQKFAVSEKDLIEGIKRSASVAQQAGVSFDELAALITAVQERTARGGAVIGNSFKTIFARIQRKDVLTDLQDMKVQVTDLEGNVLPALKVLQNLADKLGGFSQIEQANISEKLGGVFQLDKLLASLKDLSSESSVTAEALKAAAGAGNSAYEKNIILNTTLDALINKVSVSAEQLGSKLGEIGVTDSLKNVLGFFNGLLEGIQKVLGEESGLGNLVRGLVKGLGSFLAGPGLILFGAIILKLSKDLVQFGFASLKNFFGIGKAAKEVQNIEGAISQILARNVDLQQKLFGLEGNRAGQLRAITAALIEQEAILRRSSTISSGLAAPLYNVGGRATSSGLRLGGNSAGGYMPAVAKESSAIKQGVGGARSGDKPVVMPNFNFGGGKKGTMVAHTGEYVVPNFNGSGGSAVFNRRMVQSMGLPSGAKKIGAAGGFVPNFVNEADRQRKPKGLGASTILQSIGFQGDESYDEIFKKIESTYKGSKVQWVDEKTKNAFNISQNGTNLTSQAIPISAVEKQRDSKELKKGESVYDANAGFNKAVMLIPQNSPYNSSGLNVAFKEKRKVGGKIYDRFVGGIAGIQENLSDTDEIRFSKISKIDKSLSDGLSEAAFNILSGIQPGIQLDDTSDLSSKNIKNLLEKGGPGAFGALKGALFEGIVNKVAEAKGRNFQEGGSLDIDFKEGGERSRTILETIFGIGGKGYDFADFKNSRKSKDSYIDQVIKYLPKDKSISTASGGYIPNFAKYIYDSDRLAPDKGATLNSILASKVKKNLIIGPAGSGKSTFAGRSGQFLSGIDDVAKATEIDILSGAARAKGGGMSKGLESIIAAVNASGGKVSYLYAKNLEILARRSGRTSPAEGDLRSVKQLKGTKYAPLNQFDFLGNVKSKSARFNLIQAAGGYIPNFVSKSREMGDGASGTFFRLGKNKEGTDVGVKKFKNYIPSRSIEAEWLTSEFVNKYANIPGVFGPKNLSSFEDSKRKKAIRKEVVSDPLARIALGSQKASDFGQKVLFAAFKARGLQIGDFHGSNYTLNKNAQDSINGMQNFPSDPVGAFSILRQIAASGGRIGAIDVGAANVTDPARSIIGQIMARQASQKTAASGYIPNFADPLKEAVGREMAAGVPASQIYVDKNSSLKNAMNPMGLMVANRRDEPSGGFQGINRARREGANPMMYGAASGFVPNYAAPGDPDLAPFAGKTVKEASAKIQEDLTTSIQKIKDEYEKQRKDIIKNSLQIKAQIKLEDAKIKLLQDEIAASKIAVNQAKTQGVSPIEINKEESRIRQLESDLGSAESSRKKIAPINTVQENINLQAEKAKKEAKAQADAAALTTAVSQNARRSLTNPIAPRVVDPKADKAGRDLLGPIFAVQGAMTALAGATSDSSNEFAQVTNALAGGLSSFSSVSFAFSGLGQVVPKFASVLGPAGLAIGGLTAAYQIGTTLFNKYSGITTAVAISVEAMGKAAEGATISLDTLGVARKEEIKERAKEIGSDLGYGEVMTFSAPDISDAGLSTAEDFTGRRTAQFQGSFGGVLNKKLEEQYYSVIERATAQQVPESTIKGQIEIIKKDGIILASELRSFSFKMADAAKESSKQVVIFLKSIGESAAGVSDKLARMSEEQFGELLDTATIQDPEKRAQAAGYPTAAEYKGAGYEFRGYDLSDRIQTQLGISEEQYNKVFKDLDDKQKGDILTKARTEAIATKSQKEIDEPQKERDLQVNLGRLQAEINLNQKLSDKKKLILNEEQTQKEKIAEIENNISLSENAKLKAIAKINETYGRSIALLNEQEQQAKNIGDALISGLTGVAGIPGDQIPEFADKIESKVLPKFDGKDINLYQDRLRDLLTDPTLKLPSEAVKPLIEALSKAVVLNKESSDEKQKQITALEKEYGIQIKSIDATSGKLSLEKEISAQIEARNSGASFAIEKRVLNNAYESLSINKEIERIKRDTALNELQKAEEVYKLELKRKNLESTGIGIGLEQKTLNIDQELINRARSAIEGSTRIASGGLPSNLKIEDLRKIAEIDPGTLSKIDVAIQQADEQRKLAQKEADNSKAGLGDVTRGGILDKVDRGFSGGMSDATKVLQAQIATFAFDLGEKIPQMFSDNMSSAINKMIEGGESFSSVLRGAAYEFVKGINQANIQNLSNKFSNFLFGSDKTGGKSGIASIFGFASGGKVNGGSGTKDDIPAMLMGGEYVVNKKAVSKYGAQFLESLNNGTLMGYAKGGSVQKGPQGNFYTPGTFGQGAISGKRNLLDFATQTGTSGQFDQMINESGYQSVSLEPESSMLSVFGMRNSPMFEATQSAKGQAFDLYLQQYRAEKEAKKAEKEQKKAFRTQLIMMAASAIATPVIGAAASGFGAAFKGAAGQGIMSQLGAGFKGVFTGGNIGGTQVGGLGNLFSSVGKAFTGDFAGAGNQFKLSQIGSVKQLTDLYKSDKSFASYFDSMGGFNTSGAPRAIEASGFGGGVFQSGNVNRFAGGAEASDIAEAQRGLGITSDVESSTPRSNMFKKIFGGIGGIPSRIRNLFGGLGTSYGNGIFDEYGNYNEEAAAAWEKANGWGRATGGMIPSMSGIDTVPAMLSGGEFVMNRSAVQGIGAPNLQSMNSGGTSITSEETSKELNEKLLAKLDELINSSGSTGSITINVAPSGQTTQETSQDPSAGRQQLARQIKDAVLQIINDEKRIGGTLRR